MISKIAIFRALYLGDMLCIIPTVRSIRAAFPHSEIYLIGLPWQKEFADRFARYFDHFIEFPGWPGLPEQQPDREKILAFLLRISRFNFDLVLQMQGNGETTNSLCMLWNGKQVCGLRKAGEYAPDDKLFPDSTDGEHEVLRFFKLLDCLGLKSQGTQLEFPITGEEWSASRSMLEAMGLRRNEYVCVHPGARDKRRRWSTDHFAHIANKLAAHGYPVLLTGSQQEREILKDLQNKTSASLSNIVESFGHISAGELAAIIAGARLLVSNDTGVSHIASALQTASVIIFSPFSDINRWRPLDETKHIAIPYEQANDPENVWETIVKILDGVASGKSKSARTLS
ncbi:MAG: glycosyltransferase family 9 protein [Bacteroidota bacterium]|nr:glycosyltransferase family 9 protein [Bacteroidota bacterium]